MRGRRAFGQIEDRLEIFQRRLACFADARAVEPSQKPWSAWNSGKPAIDWSRPSGGTKEAKE